ncbi:MAG: hypothetical protein M1828_002810 [Chrysothrix sp. TS-e1954]|nr:MAG: hypothetical protein M1828_002810 [Chrysothrix sp. TS-e1954]
MPALNHSPEHDQGSESPPAQATGGSSSRQAQAAASSRLKRTACVLCRKRKLRCDGTRPACGTCSRLGHDCKYDEIRKKSGPKRGYVKALEARLAQVETMLKNPDGTEMDDGTLNASMADLSTLGMHDPADLSNLEHITTMRNNAFPQNMESDDPRRDPTGNLDETFSFDMIALGLEEPLPTADITDELNQIYFDKVDLSLPVMHKARFFAAMNLSPQARPPVCLRYAMWALASGVSDKYSSMQEHFYQRARKYLEIDEMRGFGQAMLTLAHCQGWLLVSMYEFKNMFFPRAWLSTGRGVRLAQMLSLHRLDGAVLDVKRTMAPPRDWTEREERRRTFWLTYWSDRCASVGTGWPMSFEEQDILTNLPAPDDAFQNSRPVKTKSLQEALTSIDGNLGSLAGCVLLATLFGRNLTHLHRPEPDDNDHDLNGKFWQRHRAIDSILLNIKLTLPEHLRLPLGIHDPNVIFLNMCIHTSSICLHQAAIFKAEKHSMPPNIAGESKMRCVVAATEITAIMRTISHMDIVSVNPFISFCLYVAARVFVQFLKARPNEQQVNTSLQFLLSVMHVMVRKNPLTESFLAQLELDMESSGVPNPHAKSSLQSLSERGVPEFRNANPAEERFPYQPWEGQKPPALSNVQIYDLGSDGKSSGSGASNTGASPGPPFNMIRDKTGRLGTSAQFVDMNDRQQSWNPADANPTTTMPYQQQKRNTPRDTFGHVHDKGLLVFDEEVNGMDAATDGSSAGATANTSQSTQPTPSSGVFTPSNNSDYNFHPPLHPSKVPTNTLPNQPIPQAPTPSAYENIPFDPTAGNLFAPSPAGMTTEDFQRMSAQLFPAGMSGGGMGANDGAGAMGGSGAGQTPGGNFSMGQSWDMGDAGVGEDWQNMMEGVTGWVGLEGMDQSTGGWEGSR